MFSLDLINEVWLVVVWIKQGVKLRSVFVLFYNLFLPKFVTYMHF